jgi:hypothetical protein
LSDDLLFAKFIGRFASNKSVNSLIRTLTSLFCCSKSNLKRESVAKNICDVEASEKSQRIVRNAASWPEQYHRYCLVRDLIQCGSQRVGTTTEMQAAIHYTQLAAFQPKQAMSIRMRNASRFQPESPLGHVAASDPCRSQ